MIGRTHSTGVPSKSMMTALNGLCVANAWRARRARNPFGSSAINPTGSPASLPKGEQ